MSMKKLRHSSLNNISLVLPILSTSEKKRTSAGLPQPFKTMLCRLRKETQRKQHPNFEEYRVGRYLQAVLRVLRVVCFPAEFNEEKYH